MLIDANWCWLMLTLESTFESTFCEHSSQDSTLQSTLVLDKLGPGQLGPTVYFFGLNLPRTLYPENFREHSKEHSREHFRDHSKNISEHPRPLDVLRAIFRCNSISLAPIPVSQWVGQWVIVSDLEIAIASPSFASLLYWKFDANIWKHLSAEHSS